MLFILLLFCSCFSQEIDVKPFSIPRGLYASASLPDAVYFAGGASLGNKIYIYDNIDIFDARQNKWTNASLSLQRAFLSGTSLPDKGLVFFSGGAYKATSLFDIYASNIIDVFNFYTNYHYTLNLTFARFDHYSTSLPNQGLLFFGGGFNPFPLQSIEIYNINSNSWSIYNLNYQAWLSTSLPSFGLAFFGGSNTFEIYDAKNNFWKNIKLLNSYSNLYSLTSLDSKGLIFFAGGQDINNIYLNNLYIYEVVKNNWKSQYLTFYAGDISTAVLNSSGLIFFCGGINSGIELDIINIYDANLDKIFVSRLSLPRSIMQSGVLENYGYVIFPGGFSEFALTISNAIDVFGTCSAGTYNNTLTTNNKICSLCSPGFYSNQSSLKCTICPTGNYCPIYGVSLPTPCSGGFFNDLQGLSLPCLLFCGPGTFCPQGSSQPILCTPGNYCPYQGLSIPIQCPKGSYNPLSGSVSINSCLKCPQGSYCNTNISATSYLPCPAQNYCSEGSVNFGIPCPAGYYCPFASTNLLICPAGSYCPTSSSVPLICPSGSYCPFGTAKGIPCRGGYQCPPGTSNPTICLKGTFAFAESSSCSFCPPGQFNMQDGSDSCQTCPISKWNTDGWFCMTEIEKGIFIIGWILAIFSSVVSSWKLYYFVKNRLKKMRNNNIPKKFRNFVFLERELKKIRSMELTSDTYPILSINDEKIKRLEDIVSNIQKEIEILKNK